MTKKDYMFVAGIVRMSWIAANQPNSAEFNRGVSEVAEHFATNAAIANPRFDRSKFLAACVRHDISETDDDIAGHWLYRPSSLADDYGNLRPHMRPRSDIDDWKGNVWETDRYGNPAIEE